MFYDKAKIHLKAGDGGNGSASMRREKFVPFGGPDGGDGGRGGSIYLKVDTSLNTLLPFKYKQHYKAQSGGNGRKRQMHGSAGYDLYIKVPPGTIFYTEPDPDHPERPVLQGDLTEPGQTIMVARAGRGGLGNTHYKTSTHQAPRMAQNGEPGEARWLRLELKILADVGLVGFPNAGKSTLLSAITAATPKIADYPFTTLEPNLGVVIIDNDYTYVVADIPGLIEGASKGVGLGHEFLRHIERTRLLVHILDGSGYSGRDPINDYEQINKELADYSPELAAKPQIVVINKVDIPETQENLARLKEYFRQKDIEPQIISAAGRQGTKELILQIAQAVKELPSATVLAASREGEIPVLTPATLDDDAFTVIVEAPGEYRVRGKRIERIVAMTPMENWEALERLQLVLDRMGISRALDREGVKGGDLVKFGEKELYWEDNR
ncbi:MAG: GTPase ObgE [Chloroflexi bacterium]|uniref:GTPase Obg n=1 Tax=Candidatus Chlorohelix allophototropha TaxID=3003348 RepID=A0A8T7M8D9_9CHLR|nr:GTPase ObgE [Chloroflexota bacterium]WJW68339.1 GTPase ObgE [Chloroflexota bacterium L227-S17]